MKIILVLLVSILLAPVMSPFAGAEEGEEPGIESATSPAIEVIEWRALGAEQRAIFEYFVMAPDMLNTPRPYPGQAGRLFHQQPECVVHQVWWYCTILN